MSKVALPNLPSNYDKASIEDVLRSLVNQVNSLSEGAGASRYQGQTVVPSATAVNLATADITWNSNPTLIGSVVSGIAASYLVLGWIATSAGTGATATQKEIRVLTGDGTGATAPFTDTTSIVKGSSDATKQLRFEVDGLTAGATRVATVQDADGTLAYINNQTFTGTCSAPTAATMTNTTQLATTAFVEQEAKLFLPAQTTPSVVALVDSAIPSGIKEINVMFAGTSTNGTSSFIIQIGDSGGIENTGYLSTVTTSGGATALTSGFKIVFNNVAASTYNGLILLRLMDSATFGWVAMGNMAQNGTTNLHSSAGSKSLSAELTTVRITTEGGVNTFDAGTVNVSYR